MMWVIMNTRRELPYSKAWGYQLSYSFKITSSAASILGNINALFGMNWDGNMDSSDYVADTILKEAKTGAKYRVKLISVSDRFEKAYDSEDGEEQPQENQIPAGSVTGTALAKEEARTGLRRLRKSWRRK